MCHHRCLVERRLTVEEDNVSVDQVAVNDVALAEVNGIGIHIPKAEGPLVTLEVDRLGAGMLVGSIADIRQQALAVVGTDNLGEGQVQSNLLGNTELVEVNVGVGRDDRAG